MLFIVLNLWYFFIILLYIGYGESDKEMQRLICIFIFSQYCQIIKYTPQTSILVCKMKLTRASVIM